MPFKNPENQTYRPLLAWLDAEQFATGRRGDEVRKAEIEPTSVTL